MPARRRKTKPAGLAGGSSDSVSVYDKTDKTKGKPIKDKGLKWTSADEMQLLELSKKEYGEWTKIGRMMGRTKRAVYARFMLMRDRGVEDAVRLADLHRFGRRAEESEEVDVPERKRMVKFTHEDDIKLLALVERHEDKNWKDVEELIPGKTGEQCRLRVRYILKLPYVYGEWTPEEDALLEKLVKENGRHWNVIAKSLPHRTTVYLQARYEYLRADRRKKKMEQMGLNGDIPRDEDSDADEEGIISEEHVFTKEEEEKMTELVETLGIKNWTRIAAQIGGVSPLQCRVHYKKDMEGRLGSGDGDDGGRVQWNREEDQLLWQLVTERDHNWPLIVRAFPGRSIMGVRARYRRLKTRKELELAGQLTNCAPDWRPFSTAEGELLESLVAKFGTNDWQTIADQMKGRDEKECRERYLGFIEPSPNSERWTAGENELLETLIERYGKRWTLIAESFRNRNARAVYRYYQKKLEAANVHQSAPQKPLKKRRTKMRAKYTKSFPPPEVPGQPNKSRVLRKGRFTKAEDEELMRCLKEYGEDWVAIADKMGMRSQEQCYERYVVAIEPELRQGRWTATEKKLLENAVKAQGEQWDSIVKEFPGRSHINVYGQFLKLVDDQSDDVTSEEENEGESEPDSESYENDETDQTENVPASENNDDVEETSDDVEHEKLGRSVAVEPGECVSDSSGEVVESACGDSEKEKSDSELQGNNDGDITDPWKVVVNNDNEKLMNLMRLFGPSDKDGIV